MAAIELEGAILHQRTHSTQLHKVLKDVLFTATYFCLINTHNRVEYTQLLQLLHDIRNMPTFPHSIPKKIEEKAVLMPHVEHPMFK